MLSSKEILLEYAKCLNNPIYPIVTYLKTYDKTNEGYVPFNLFTKQKEVINAYENHRQNLVTKPRQAGISTTTQAWCSVKVAFADTENPETIIVIANKLNLAKKFIRGIKDYINQMPRWVWGEDYYGSEKNEKKSIFVVESQTEIELINGCKIVAVATSTDALRGYTPTILIFDEAAFIENGDALYSAAITSLGTGGKVILISTPNGYDKLYYKAYENSKLGRNKYKITEMRWYQDPRYNKNLKWVKDDEVVEEVEFTDESYDRMVKSGYKPTSPWYVEMCEFMHYDKKRIAQELDVSFVGSGGNVIDEEYINYHELNNVREPKIIDSTYFDGDSGYIYIWEEPQEGHEYIMVGDVSRGDGEDYSAFQIVDFTTMEQVAEFQGKVPPDVLAIILNTYGLKYKAYLVVDNIGVGHTTVSKLLELNYPYLHYDDIKANNENKTPGFNINGVRLNVISNFEIAVRTNIIKIRSMRTVGEMKTFIYKNGKPDHKDGYNDDCLISLAIALWVLEYKFKNLEKLKKQDIAMLSSWVTSSDNQPEPSPRSNNAYHRNENYKAYAQYSWLFGKAQ